MCKSILIDPQTVKRGVVELLHIRVTVPQLNLQQDNSASTKGESHTLYTPNGVDTHIELLLLHYITVWRHVYSWNWCSGSMGQSSDLIH